MTALDTTSWRHDDHTGDHDIRARHDFHTAIGRHGPLPAQPLPGSDRQMVPFTGGLASACPI